MPASRAYFGTDGVRGVVGESLTDELLARLGVAFARWSEGYPGWDDGENYEAMTDRVLGTIHGIACAHKDGRVLVVSHGGPIRAIHAAALHLDIHAYRRLRPVEPNARLSAVCHVQGLLTELCPATEIDALIERDRDERLAAAAHPPTPAG